MTLDNLQYALYLNNRIILDRIKAVKDAIDSVVSTDIGELKELVDEINNSGLSDIRNLISDLDNDLSNHISDTVVHVTQDDKDLWNSTLQNAKDYAKKLFNGVTSFTIKIVNTLPTEDIKLMTIYFVPNNKDDNTNYYDEYMYINNTWELIGSTLIDLTPYLLKQDFEKYQQEIANKFLEYKTSDEITNILSNYLLTDNFQDILKNYSTTKEIENKLHNHNNKTLLDGISIDKDYVLFVTDEILYTITQRGYSLECKENGYLIADIWYESGGNAHLYINGQYVAGSNGSNGNGDLNCHFETKVSKGDIIATRGSYGGYDIKIYKIIYLLDATKDIETDDDINNAITETLKYLKGDV